MTEAGASSETPESASKAGKATPTSGDRRRYGRMLQCPFCSENMYSNYFKSHVFGYRDLPPICGGARERYPNGMTEEEYKRVQIIASEEAAFSKLPPDVRQRVIAGEGARQQPARPTPTPGPSSSVNENPPMFEKPISVPDPRPPIGVMIKCAICSVEVSMPATLYLPCCFRQRTCLWCLVRAGRCGALLRCKFCGIAFAPPNNPLVASPMKKKRQYRRRVPKPIADLISKELADKNTEDDERAFHSE